MPRSTLIPATTEAAESGIFRIPTLRWSPDANLTQGVHVNPVDGSTTVNDYDGRELAPRAVRLLLHAGRGHELPADAEIVVEARVYDEVPANDEPGSQPIPEQWEAFAKLTPTQKNLCMFYPIEDVRVRKPASGEIPYGVVAFGLHSNTDSATA